MKKEYKLSERTNYAEMYLTLRCNFNCSYCINDFDKVKRKRNEMIGEEWVNALNRIDFGNIPVTFGGGEPTKHKDFYHILQNLDKDTNVDLLSNLSFDIDKFMSNTTPERFTQSDIPSYRPIRVSYHVGQSNPLDLVSKARRLQDEGYNIGIFGLAIPDNINKNMEMAELCRMNKVFFYPKDFLGKINGEMYGHYKYPKGLDGILKDVKCRTKELLVAPDGMIYRCHRDLYKNENSLWTIKKGIISDGFRKCSNYGDCNPCDVKRKTNKFLDEVDCQVEIVE